MSNPPLKLREFSPELAPHFKKINEEWITDMFRLEEKDQRVLDDPQNQIIASGGFIFFAEDPELGIIGTCALLKTRTDEYELTKMGVLKKARGKNAGKFLLQAAIEKAQEIKARRLYLLTNKKCEAAIHLYQTYGFQHDPLIMQDYGQEYDRCDVAMIYRPTQ
jgi:GNAT superfamily N-acetyltransferase